MGVSGNYPLEWPAGQPRARHRVHSNFRVASGSYSRRRRSLAEARNELAAEIDRLGARRAVISSNVALRNDGLPRSGRRAPDDPGVAVYFDLRGERQVIAIDRYQHVECNVYAIARTISALRQIERDGGPLAAYRAGHLAVAT